MELVQVVTRWTEAYFLPLGPFGLFLLAFIESSFFPIPPDVLLIPLVLDAPGAWILLATMATVGSVTGAVLGYYVGREGGRPVLDRMFGDRKIDMVERYYDDYGIHAVGVAGFSPIPYKVFAISAGTFRMDLLEFTVISTLSRGARFFLLAYLTAAYGDRILSFIEGYFGPLSLIIAVTLAGLYFLYTRVSLDLWETS